MNQIPQQMRKFKITFNDMVLGTAPLNKNVYQDWIASRAPKPEDGDEEVEMITDEKGMTGFHRDPDGIYIMNYMVKGFLKEAGNNLKEIFDPPAEPEKTEGEEDESPKKRVIKKAKPKKGITNLRSKIDNYVFIRPRHLWLKEDHDGILERPIRVMTPQGPRVSLAASQYVDAGTEIEFKIVLLPHKELNWDVIEMLLNYGEFKGIGQWRNADYGSFSWQRIDNGA